MARTALFNRRQVGGVFSIIDEKQTTGNYYFVNSATGTDSVGNGVNPDFPFDTLAYALTQTTANQGDTIIVMPGHTETVVAASGIDFIAAGVEVIGQGLGAAKPTITMGTATTASLDFSAANCRLSGFRFVCDIDSLAAFIIGSTSANGAIIEDCDFVNGTSKEYLTAITVPTTFDDWKIRRCRFIQASDPAGTNGGAGTGAVYIVDSENVEIDDCEFRGNFETAFIHNRTTGAVNLWVRRCFGICSLADAVPFVLATGATGGADRCSFITPASTDIVEATTSGTFTAGFFNFLSYFGNDGGGGQLAMACTSAAS